MKDELVSIIMPCLNSESYIGGSIESVINQTYTEWELIVCDDGSEDKTLKIANSFKHKEQRISVISNMHKKGAAGSRNSCLDIAKGKYIAFLDSDDLWYPDKLKIQIDFMKKNNCSFTFSYVDIIDEANNHLKIYKSPKKINAKLMMFNNFIPCCTVVYDSSKIGKIHQPDIKKRNDYALWLTILKNHLQYCYCVPQVTAAYRSNSYGLASNKIDNIKYYYKCRIKYANSNHILAAFELIIYLATMFLKTKFTNLYNKVVTKL